MAVTNVSLKQPNWIAVALQIGDVVIETAGATGQMTFLSMYQPSKVANEILQRVENVREQPWQVQREQQHASFLRWFGAFHSVLEEDGSIRTPPSSGRSPASDSSAPPGEDTPPSASANSSTSTSQ